MKTAVRWFFCVAVKWCGLVAPLALVIGCHVLPSRPKTPAATITTPAGATLTQSGDAQAAASVATSTATHSITIPAGSLVEFSEKLGTVTYRLSRDSVVSSTARTETATAPQAFTPPAPPSPAQVAQGYGVAAFWIGALVCFAIAGLLAWSTHYLAAGCFGLGGVALPILARFLSSGLALGVAGALAAAGGALFVAWHVLQKRGAV